MEVSGSSNLSQVELSPSMIQSPNYFSGDGVTSATITTNGAISASDLFDPSYIQKRDEYNQISSGIAAAQDARDAAIQTKISNIISYLEEGHEDNAMEAYNKLLEEMKKQRKYGTLATEDDDTQLRAAAKQMIEQSSGKNLEEIIRENAKNQSDVESQKIRTWGNCDNVTQEELLLAMCDVKQEAGHSNILTDICNVIISPFYVIGNYLFNGGKKVS